MESKEQRSVTKNMKLIMKYLMIAEYGIDNWNMESMRVTLTSPSSCRNELLFWVLNMFGLTYTTQEQRIFNQPVINKIVNHLSSIGICRPQDANLINGSGSKASQLIFWRNLLELGIRLRSNPHSSLGQNSDEVIHNVIHSSYYEDAMKDEDLNILPKDLQLQYKSASKPVYDWRQWKTELEEKIQKERELLESQPPLNDSVGDLTDLIEKIPNLVTQSRAFIATHEASLKPWCSGSELPPPDVFRETDQTVEQCFEQLHRFQKSVALATNVEASHERISRKMRMLKEQNNPPAAVLLDSIVNP